MKEPKLLKRCRHNHNDIPSGTHKEGMSYADCEVCGDCVRAYNKLYEKYEKWLDKSKKKTAVTPKGID